MYLVEVHCTTHIIPTIRSIGIVSTTGHGLVIVALEANQTALAIVITEIFVDKK